MDVPGDESVHHHYIVWEPAKPSCGSDSYGRTMASMVHPEADWNDLTVEMEDAAEGWFGVRPIDRELGAEHWQIDLDASSGHGELFPHTSRRMIVDGVALLQTFGEHDRGATSHDHKLHCLSADGERM